jgi:hypothetical protein
MYALNTNILPAAGLRGIPPPLSLDLIDGNHLVGWIRGDVIGFRGFADADEAGHSAWVAHRTLARRLVRRHGGRPIPIVGATIGFQADGERELILANGAPVATLVHPGDESLSGAHSFGFEIRLPVPVDEGRARSKARLMYRALRKSGIRWKLWSRDGPRDGPRDGGPALVRREHERAQRRQ